MLLAYELACQPQSAHLISISPEEVLCPKVLVWILDSLLQWRKMAPVLPMLIPQILCIDAPKDQAWYDDASNCQCPHAERNRGKDWFALDR